MTNQRLPTDERGGPERILGAQARAYREKLGMTQDEVAEAMRARGFAKMGQSTITKIENAQRPVRVNEAVALAAVLHADVADLLTAPPPDGRDPLTVARDEERELARQLRITERGLEHANIKLAAAQWEMQVALDQVADLRARHAKAREKVAALTAAEGSGSDVAR